jgi:hypothetical protein
MLDIMRKDKNSKVLVVTPLLPGHKVSKETKKTIKRNVTPFTWITYSGNNNIPTNIEIGINEYRNKGSHIPPYILPLDRDIILGRHMLDRMVSIIDITPDYIAYVYANFEFKGHINRRFTADPYDINKLLLGNYISSNSLIKLKCLEDIGGFITDDKYKRLLDWSLWLKFYLYGYVGIPCPLANFIAMSTENDISAGSEEEYKMKYMYVMQDFVKPIIERSKGEMKKEEETSQEPEILSFDDVI